MEPKIKILLVDDEEKFLHSIAERLSLRGFDVVAASNGEKAIQEAEKGGFDLALLDLKMPGMDGTQVLKILKEKHEYIEVVILTGHGSLESAVECVKLGAYGYLPKPYELDKLLDILKEAYQERLKKKFAQDEQRIDKLMKIASGNSPLAILREMRNLDDDKK